MSKIKKEVIMTNLDKNTRNENIIGVERTEFKPVDFKESLDAFFDKSKQEAAESSVQR